MEFGVVMGNRRMYLERFYIFVSRRMSFHICDSINSHIWNDRITYV